MITKESDQDVVDAGEFWWLLGGELSEEDESLNLNGTEDLPELNCEGIFNKENPHMLDDDGDKLMGLESEESRESILKWLGNSKHKPFNKYALEDGFVLGKERLDDIVEIQAKVLAREKRADDQINMAVNYFFWRTLQKMQYNGKAER